MIVRHSKEIDDGNDSENVFLDGETNNHDSGAVSYTHLTLPTKRIV